MKKIITATILFSIIIGTFAVIISQLGFTPTYLTAENVGNTNLQWYKINILGYLNNLVKQLNNSNFLKLFPQQPEQIIKTNTDVLTYNFSLILKGLSYAINWLIYVLNIFLIVPIKVLMVSPVRFFLAILGLDQLNLTQWLDQVATIEIPYIATNW